MANETNPLLAKWTSPHQVPPFETIEPEHFAEAFDQSIAAYLQEVSEIAGQTEHPSFENTIDALELSGRQLERVAAVFFNLASADTNERLQELERDISPRLAKLSSEIYLNPALFQRVDALFADDKSSNLSPEKARILERYHTRFVRSGARLDAPGKARMTEISERLAALGTRFAQNVLADENAFRLVLEEEEDLSGLPEFLRGAAAASAEALGHPGKFVITLARSSVEPFLQFSDRRDLREKVFAAWTGRGATGGETDNRKLIKEMLELRDEQARLLGFKSFSAFKLDDMMAKTSSAVRKLLNDVWPPALKQALKERDGLQAMVRSEGANFEVAPSDWHYYSEKVRRAKHDLNEAAIKPYFQLDQIIAAAFETAHRLFGLTFEPRHDIPIYHPDVRVWEVFGRDGRHVGLFLGDYYARPSKRGGAWMSAFRSQQKLGGDISPIIVNVLNVVKGDPDQPALLSFEDARTVFHEFGHALHGLLSDVTYPLISGTSVATDYVELPSQLYEHWLLEPEILRKFAVHAETGEVIPDDLLKRLIAARNFNIGFRTVEYVASAIVDLDFHDASLEASTEPDAHEAACLERIGMPPEITMRHRMPHFLHLFGGSGYPSAYYSYLWSEVMDADAFRAFQETGDIFDPEIAERLYRNIYSSGGKHEPAEAYKAFRGR
ncbi:MAG: M3 family metallopeptidase, partial [Methyloligellaceae bacterium]